ncbi:HD domain-containing protein [Cytobacillus gottheilii]|uniref:HD domain-containing protein n=1 Tax=Cytobacillus gottheilii TaxID=859144 RepID=UPI00082CB46F|nr:HD domain-containing protein [Cytobacillus gottheilii]
MDQREIIEKTELFVQQVMQEDCTGHDWYHVNRVRDTAKYIHKQEKLGDLFIIEMSALLHDVADEKLNKSKEAGEKKLNSFLQELSLPSETSEEIINVIAGISYKGGNNHRTLTIEAKIVQDADRLDALGAVGIARTFAYGGSKNLPIYDPALTVRNEMTVEEYRQGKSSSINHFYEKLLKLKERLNTQSAIKIADDRHHFMETFLQQFFNEWNGYYENDFS